MGHKSKADQEGAGPMEVDAGPDEKGSELPDLTMEDESGGVSGTADRRGCDGTLAEGVGVVARAADAEFGSCNAHVYFVMDATGSMGTFLESLKDSLHEVAVLADLLFKGRVKLHLVHYEDYCDGDRVVMGHHGSFQEILEAAARLRPGGGGDAPEAVKTAFSYVAEEVARDRSRCTEERHLVLHYTDAYPHYECAHLSDDSNPGQEREALAAKPWGFDWFALCRQFHELQVPVYTFHNSEGCASCFLPLGDVVCLSSTTKAEITEATMGVILRLMGEGPDTAPAASFHRCTASSVDMQAPERAGDERLRGSLPPCSEFALEALPWLRCNLRGLLAAFRKDPAFVDLVYSRLETLFDPRYVVSVTHNPVLGKLWRLCCRRRDDERTGLLSNALSKAIAELDSDNDRKLVKAWLEASFDYSEDIAATINGLPSELHRPCLVLDAVDQSELPSRDDLKNIGRESVSQRVQKLPTHLFVMTDEMAGELPVLDGVPLYLPLALKDKDLFACLPHLVNPGQWYSHRPAAVMAVLCYLSGVQPLAARAERWLTGMRGAWIPLAEVEKFPEVVQTDFVNLMHRARRFLTDAEQAVFERLWLLRRFRLAQKEVFTVTTGYTPPTREFAARPDNKRPCSRCGHLRSFTLLCDGDVCGLCLSQPEEDVLCPQRRRARDLEWYTWAEFRAYYGKAMAKQMWEEAARSTNSWVRKAMTAPLRHTDEPVGKAFPSPFGERPESNMVECCKCQALYEVVDTAAFPIAKLNAKCHFCRAGTSAQTIVCRVCLNKFCCPSQSDRASSTGDFECAVCVQEAGGPASFTKSDVLAQDLFEENPSAAAAIGLPAAVVGSQATLFQVMTEQAIREAVFADPGESPAGLTYNKKPIHGIPGLFEMLSERIVRGSLSELCGLCLSEKLTVDLHLSCGRCQGQACRQCLKSWYGAVRPGMLVLPTHLNCAFCRQPPRDRVLKTFNREAMAIVREGFKGLRSDIYYGWCVECYKMKEFMERHCADSPPQLRPGEFVCSECSEARHSGVQKKYKQCPGCKAPTHRTGGCAHMMCSQCDQHWCWVCGIGEGSADATYAHIRREHGGVIFADEEDGNDEAGD